MSAFARANSPEVTAVDPRRKSRATVCAFTRHPTAVATAVGHLMTLHLPGYVHKVAEVLITHCDREGVCWLKTTEELARLTGVSPKRIQVAGRILRALGLVTWLWVKHKQRYPLRRSYHEPVRFGAGRGAGYGGRVWVVHWEKFGVKWPSRKLGKQLAVSDPPGSLMSDPIGSLLRSSRLFETYDRSRTRQERERAAPAAPAPQDPASLVPLATASPAATRETIDGETPGAATVCDASPPGPSPRPDVTNAGSERKSELKREGSAPPGRAPSVARSEIAALGRALFDATASARRPSASASSSTGGSSDPDG